jgi:geranylgeranyl pyrophosphate synthase
VIYGLQKSEGNERKRLKKFYTQESIEGEDNTEVKEILDHSGARNYAENLSQQYYHKALLHLGATELDSSRLAPLKKITNFLLERNF